MVDRGYEVYPSKMAKELKEILVKLRNHCEEKGCFFLAPRTFGSVLTKIVDDKGEEKITLAETESSSLVKNHNCIVGVLRRPIGNISLSTLYKLFFTLKFC